MPAHRLPWLKLWPECMAHEKISMLSDELGWTWIKCLCFAAQQRVRWRFAGLDHAAAVTGRSLTQIEALIERGLLDQREDGLWIHDYQDWQERYPSDIPRRAEETVPHGGTTMEATLREHSANTPRTLREHSTKTGEERGETLTLPTGGSARAREAPPPQARQKRLAEDLHPALRVVKEVLKSWPVPGVREAIVQAVGLEEEALGRWRQVCLAVGLNGINPRNMACALDWFRDGIPERRGSTGGSTHGSAQRPGDGWDTIAQQRRDTAPLGGHSG